MEEIHKEKNVVKKKKKNWGALILIVTIVVMVLLVGLMCADVFHLGKKSENKENPDNIVVKDNNINITWNKYLEDKVITNISIERTSDSSPEDPTQEYHNTVNLSEDQIKQFLKDVDAYTLSKHYLERAYFTTGDIVSINYEIEGAPYKLVITNGEMYFGREPEMVIDDELKYILENTVTNIENATIKDNAGVFYSYKIDGYDSSSLLDKYFEQ